MGHKVTLRHKVTGKVAEYPAHYLNHFGLRDVLEPVDEGTPVDGCTDCGLPERREDCDGKPEDCLEAEDEAMHNAAPTAPDHLDGDEKVVEAPEVEKVVEADNDIEVVDPDEEAERQSVGQKLKNWYNG